MKYSLLFILLSIIMLSSCTVQKRRYSSGLHINWRLNLKSKSTQLAKTNPPIVKDDPKLITSINSDQNCFLYNSNTDVEIVKNVSLITKAPKKRKLKGHSPASTNDFPGDTSKKLHKIAHSMQKLEIVKQLSENHPRIWKETTLIVKVF